MPVHAFRRRDAIGSQEDPKNAVVWFTSAADAGHRKAFHALGVLYLGGFGLAKDMDKAVSYFKRGVELGLKQAKAENE